jgi:hypothetical protein
MSLPLSCSASRVMPLPNRGAGYSNTGLRRLEETLQSGCELSGGYMHPLRRLTVLR